MVEKNSIIAGGSITSMLLREKVNDYDIYFTNKDVVYAVAQYYVARFNPLLKNGIAKVKQLIKPAKSFV